MTNSKEQRSEVATLVRQAVEQYGMSHVITDPDDATRLHVTLRPPHSSRTFSATVHVTAGYEV